MYVNVEKIFWIVQEWRAQTRKCRTSPTPTSTLALTPKQYTRLTFNLCLCAMIKNPTYLHAEVKNSDIINVTFLVEFYNFFSLRSTISLDDHIRILIAPWKIASIFRTVIKDCRYTTLLNHCPIMMMHLRRYGALSSLCSFLVNS